MSDDTRIACQLAACLASIRQHIDGVAKGSPVSIAIVRDSLMAAESALDGSTIGPLDESTRDESHPSTWGDWADDLRFGLATPLLDDDDVLLLDDLVELATA